MNIETAQKAKANLERDILELIQKFHTETGLRVVGLQFKESTQSHTSHGAFIPEHVKVIITL